MKLSILVVDLGKVWGGQEIYSQRLMESLRKEGHTVVSLSSKERHSSAADSHYLQDGSYLAFLLLRKKIAELVSEYSIDVVHFNGNRAMYLSMLIKLPCRVVATKHAPFFMGSKKPLKHRIARFLSTFLFRRIDHIVCVAQATYNDLPTRCRLKASVIENGVPDKAEGVSSIEKTDTIRLCYVARLVESKGIDRLMEGVIAASKKGYPCHLTIAGDGPLKEQVLALSKAYPNLLDFHGFVDDPSEIYRNADICCLPSLNEGMPLNILESFSFGLPVIVTDIPSLREVVNTSNGWILLDNQASTIADMIERIVNEKDQLTKKSLIARQCYEDKYSLEAMVSKTLGIYYG